MMETIILLILLVLAGFIIRILFNSEWRNNAQEKIDAVKKERIFWRLVKGYEGLTLNVKAIFTVYLDPRHLTSFLTSHNTRSEDDLRVLRLLDKKKGFESIHIMNNALEKASKSILDILAADNKSYSKAEIKKLFEEHKDEQLYVPEQYDKLVSYYLKWLPDTINLKSNIIWSMREKISSATYELEWKTEEIKVSEEALFDLKKSDEEIGEVIGNILCNKESLTLREVLADWEHLQMLKWCIVDFVAPWNNTNLIQRFMWQVISDIAS